jgi:sortase A
MTFLARALRSGAPSGGGVARLRIPAIGAEHVVVDGTRTADLRRGPGFYEGNPLPGARGTVAIAGHRTTFGAPFREIDDLARGDAIDVETPYGRFSYRVEKLRIVKPTDVWVARRRSYDRLILTACHPLYSAALRIVVFARLVRSEPRGAALARPA